MIVGCVSEGGFRSYRKRENHRKSVEQTLRELNPSIIYSTCARGPHLWAADFARKNKIPLCLFLPCKENKKENMEEDYRMRQLARKYADSIIYADREFAGLYCQIPSNTATKRYLEELDSYKAHKKHWAEATMLNAMKEQDTLIVFRPYCYSTVFVNVVYHCSAKIHEVRLDREGKRLYSGVPNVKEI